MHTVRPTATRYRDREVRGGSPAPDPGTVLHALSPKNLCLLINASDDQGVGPLGSIRRGGRPILRRPPQWVVGGVWCFGCAPQVALL